MRIRTGGELLSISSELRWAGRLVERALGLTTAAPVAADPIVVGLDAEAPAETPGASATSGASAEVPGAPADAAELAGAEPAGTVARDGDQAADLTEEPTIRLVIEAARHGFDRTGLRVITRGAYTNGRRTLLQNVGGSGFDLLVNAGTHLCVRARYRPSKPVRLANLMMSSRFGLLAGQVLVHYPVLWRAGWHGRVPLHASVVATGSGTALLAGPGGVGKSTVLGAALAAGATATADNLCCADDQRCYGIAEPLRTDADGSVGPRTSHGRVDRAFSGRVPALEPDRLFVLERGPVTDITEIKPDEAARALIAGTYAAGELRRYWAFAATLALATGHGPAHPPIEQIAMQYAERLPCVRVRVGDNDQIDLAALCAQWERQQWVSG